MAQQLYRNGSAYVIADKRNEGRFRVIFTDDSGRQRERSGGRELAKAKKVADSIARQGGRRDPSELTVSALVEAYLLSKSNLAESSSAKNASYMRQHISVDIGNVICRDLDAVKVTTAFKATAGYAHETRLSIGALYRALGRFGVQHGAWTADRNPFTQIKAPRPKIGDHVTSKLLKPSDIPTRDQVCDLLAVMEDQGHALFADAGHVIDVTGVRWQEVAPLAGEHVDLDALTISIRQAISRGKGGRPVLGVPKSLAAYRVIPITVGLAERLAPRIAECGSGLLFVGPRGGLPRSSAVHRYVLKPARAASNYPLHCAWHSIRHTTITRWVQTGEVTVASKLAGHETLSFTLDKYVGHDDDHLTVARTIVT